MYCTNLVPSKFRAHISYTARLYIYIYICALLFGLTDETPIKTFEVGLLKSEMKVKSLRVKYK